MNLRDYDIRYVYRRWKEQLGPFECFIRSGPFVSIQTYDDFEINKEVEENVLYNQYEKYINYILKSDFKEQLVIVDKPFNEVLAIGYLLNNLFNIKPILNANFLFHPYGLIGHQSDIEKLIQYGVNLKSIRPVGYVMLLNHERYDVFNEALYKKKLNNQYEMSKEDFPSKEMLKELGYKRIIFFSEGKIKEDIEEYLDEMEDTFKVERRDKYE